MMNGVIVVGDKPLQGKSITLGGVQSSSEQIAKLLGIEIKSWQDYMVVQGKPSNIPYYRYALIDRNVLLNQYISFREKLGFFYDFILADDCQNIFYKGKTPMITLAQNAYADIPETVRDYSFESILEFGLAYYEFQKAQFAKSKKIIAVSNYMKDYVKRAGFDSEVVEWGVDLDVFKPLNKSELRKKYGVPLDKPVGLFATKFHPIKGYRIQAQLAREFRDVHWVFLFMHAPPEKVRLPNVTVLPPQYPQEKMAEIYNLADFVVCPSANESFNLTWAEACACNVPVICSKTGYLWDKEPGSQKWGICVKDHFYESYENAVKEILDHPALNPREFVVENKLDLKSWEEKFKKAIGLCQTG